MYTQVHQTESRIGSDFVTYVRHLSQSLIATVIKRTNAEYNTKSHCSQFFFQTQRKQFLLRSNKSNA